MKIRRALAFICVALLLTVCGCGNASKTDVKPQTDNKAYRNVKVIEVAGEATLTRQEKKQSVYKQMLINGDDNIVTQVNSTVDLLLDSDKYARIYENSDVTFKLEGDTVKGAILIYLNSGGINNKIENKLSVNDSYEVHTPDAVMAVRGTEFEVKVIFDGGTRQTKVTTESGSVQITLLNDEGDQILSETGNTTIIESKMDSDGNMGEPELKAESTAETTSSDTGDVNSKPQDVASNVQTTSDVPQETDTAIFCPKCDVQLQNGSTHLLTCAVEHYSCDEYDHSICKDCNKYMCDLTVHKAFKCQVHYPCSPDVYDGHEALDCGHYLCGIINDSETVIHEICKTCNTYGCKTEKQHFWAECGCVYCEEALVAEHIICEACGLCMSDGKEHGDGVCNIQQ